VPILVGSRPIHIDLERQRLHRLPDVGHEVEIAERGEQERRRFARDPGDPDEATGDDPAQGSARHDAQRRAPARVPECQGRLTQRVGHEAHHLFGGARDHRDHQDRQGAAAREGRVPSHRLDQPCPGEDPDHDGRSAVHDVGDEAHHEAQASGPVLGKKETDADPDGEADEPCHPNDDARAHDAIGDPASCLARGHGTLREKRPVDGGRALGDEVAEDEHEREDGRERH